MLSIDVDIEVHILLNSGADGRLSGSGVLFGHEGEKVFYVTVFWESERGKKKKEPGKLSFEEGE